MIQDELNNKNLPFRPLDNSMSTQIKYELEMEHWARAQKSVSSRNTTSGVNEVALLFSAFFGILSGLLSIFLFIFAGCVDLFRRWKEDRDSDRAHKRYMDRLDKVIAANQKPKGYDTPDSEYETDD